MEGKRGGPRFQSWFYFFLPTKTRPQRLINTLLSATTARSRSTILLKTKDNKKKKREAFPLDTMDTTQHTRHKKGYLLLAVHLLGRCCSDDLPRHLICNDPSGRGQTHFTAFFLPTSRFPSPFKTVPVKIPPFYNKCVYTLLECRTNNREYRTNYTLHG